MTEQPISPTATVTTMQGHPALAKRQLRKDIGASWDKFSRQELSALRDSDDLVAGLVAKYGLEKEVATRFAAAVVKGRAF